MTNPPRASGGHAITVLVVEDEPALRFVITESFSTEAGFDVIGAASGDEAIERLKLYDRIDCVFTDVRMPGAVDGVALANHVLVEYPRVKIVMASGNLRPNERIGSVPFFAKPYDMTSVAKTIRELVAS